MGGQYQRRGVTRLGKIALAAVLAVASFIGAGPQPARAIVHGTELTVADFAPTGRFPWLVFEEGFLGECTGSLIAPEWVLTAGHCGRMTTVRYGHPNKLLALDVAVVAEFAPLQFDVNNPTVGFDFRLLRLAAPLPGPFAPLGGNVVAHIGETLRIAGWGLMEGLPFFASPDVAREGTMRIGSIQTKLIGANPDPSNACFGDSGGPGLLERNGGLALIGVTSFGNENCSAANGFGRIALVRDWIEAVAGPLPVVANTAPTVGTAATFAAPGRVGVLVWPPIVDVDADEVAVALSAVPAGWALLDACDDQNKQCRFVAPDPGTFTLTVTASDALGGGQGTAEVHVADVAPTGTGPTAPVYDGDLTTGVEFPVNLLDQGLTQPPTDADDPIDRLLIAIDPGDGSPPALTTFDDHFARATHTYTAPGTFTSTITVRDPNGNDDTVARLVHVLPNSLKLPRAVTFVNADAVIGVRPVPVRLDFARPLTSPVEVGVVVDPASSVTGVLPASVSIPAGATRGTFIVQMPLTAGDRSVFTLVQLTGDPIFVTPESATIAVDSLVGDTDLDGDSLPDSLETVANAADDDVDDDGLLDGLDSATFLADVDDDGLPDGLEVGLTAPQGYDTDLAAGHFRPDLDPASTTNPFVADTDGDGIIDGTEDANHNGRVDAGETDPTSDPIRLIVDAGPDQAVGFGATVTLTATLAGGDGSPITSVHWSGANVDAPNALTTTFAAFGSATLNVTVCNVTRCGSDFLSVFVQGVDVTVDAGPDLRARAGSPVTVTATATAPANVPAFLGAVLWGDAVDFELFDGVPATAEFTHTFAAPGTYDNLVCFVIGDSSGCDTMIIEVGGPNAPPIVQAGPASGLEGSNIALAAVATDTDNDPLSFSWSFAAGPAMQCTAAGAATANASLTCVDDGVVVATVHVTDGFDTVSADVQVTISNVAPTLAIATQPVDGAVQVGVPLTLTSTITDPGTADVVTCSIDWGDGAVQQACAGTHAYSTAGPKQVIVTANDGDGGSATATATATVTDAHRADVLLARNGQRTLSVAPLNGRTVTTADDLYVFVSGHPNVPSIRQVTFSLDGVVFSVDRGAPFDLAGSARPTAPAWALDADLLAPGPHTIAAIVVFAGGSSEGLAATFNVVGTGSRSLMVSTRANRSNPVTLDGARLSGKVAIFLGPNTSITDLGAVTMLLDGRLQSLDLTTPYDLRGGTTSTAVMLDIAGLRAGPHTVRAIVVLRGGGYLIYDATFTK